MAEIYKLPKNEIKDEKTEIYKLPKNEIKKNKLKNFMISSIILLFLI